MLELHDTDGCKIAFYPEKVEYIQEADIIGGEFTILCFAGGNRVLVDEEYEDVKRMLDEALTAEV